MLIDYSTTKPTDNYKLMSQTIIPRPIAWIVTENEGIINAAPFSYFTGLSSNPPTMIVSIGHKSDGSPKDTLANLRSTGKCTLCMVNPEYLEKMHFSSKELPSEVSEANEFDIELERLVDDYPPLIKGTPSAFFCDLFGEVDLGESKTIPLILEIKHQYIDGNSITDEEKMSIDLKTVARVGKRYALPGKEIKVPD